MSTYEAFPDLEPIDLCDDELEQFVKSSIFPAAHHLWGDAYRDADLAPLLSPATKVVESQYHDGRKIELSFGPQTETQLGDDGEIDENIPPDVYLRAELNSHRPDLTAFFGRKFSGSNFEIWESCVYDFYVDGIFHEADSYYVIRDLEGEDMDIDEVSKRQRLDLKRIAAHPKYTLDRSAEINTQDIIDIRNILLALEIPEELIGL